MIQKKSKYNNMLIGVILGLIIPILVMFLIIAMQSGANFQGYYKQLNSLGLTADILRMSIVADLLVFYFFLNKKFYNAVKGVIISAVILGLYVVYIKFLR